jgi:hypothetical protein
LVARRGVEPRACPPFFSVSMYVAGTAGHCWTGREADTPLQTPRSPTVSMLQG